MDPNFVSQVAESLTLGGHLSMAQGLLFRLNPAWQAWVVALADLSASPELDFEAFFRQHFYMVDLPVTSPKVNASLILFARLGNVAMLERVHEVVRSKQFSIDYVPFVQGPLPLATLQFLMREILSFGDVENLMRGLVDQALVMIDRQNFDYLLSLESQIFYRALFFSDKRRIFILSHAHRWALEQINEFLSEECDRERWVDSAMLTYSPSRLEKCLRVMASRKIYSRVALARRFLSLIGALDLTNVRLSMLQYLLDTIPHQESHLEAEIWALLQRASEELSRVVFPMVRARVEELGLYTEAIRERLRQVARERVYGISNKSDWL